MFWDIIHCSLFCIDMFGWYPKVPKINKCIIKSINHLLFQDSPKMPQRKSMLSRRIRPQSVIGRLLCCVVLWCMLNTDCSHGICHHLQGSETPAYCLVHFHICSIEQNIMVWCCTSVSPSTHTACLPVLVPCQQANTEETSLCGLSIVFLGTLLSFFFNNFDGILEKLYKYWGTDPPGQDHMYVLKSIFVSHRYLQLHIKFSWHATILLVPKELPIGVKWLSYV